MAVFSKGREAAQKAADKAQATVDEWNAKAAAARADAQQLDADAGAQILADESAAERITLQIQSLERKARAYDQAATEAARNLHAAQHDVLTAEAAELEKQAAGIRKQAEKQEAEVQKILAQLEALDESKWERAEIPGTGTEHSTQSYAGKAAGIVWEALALETRAQVIRYWLAKGTIPADLRDLNNMFGPTHDVHITVLGTEYLDKYGDPITDTLRQAVAAGLSFAA